MKPLNQRRAAKYLAIAAITAVLVTIVPNAALADTAEEVKTAIMERTAYSNDLRNLSRRR